MSEENEVQEGVACGNGTADCDSHARVLPPSSVKAEPAIVAYTCFHLFYSLLHTVTAAPLPPTVYCKHMKRKVEFQVEQEQKKKNIVSKKASDLTG